MLTVLLASAFPIPWFYVTRAIAPDQVVRRAHARLRRAFSIGMVVGQNAIAQRYTGTLKLLISMPVSKSAYVLGSLAYSSVSGTQRFSPDGVRAVGRSGHRLGLGTGAVFSSDRVYDVGPLFIVSFAPSLQAGHKHRSRRSCWPRLLHDGSSAAGPDLDTSLHCDTRLTG